LTDQPEAAKLSLVNRHLSRLLLAALLVSVTLLFFVHVPVGSFQATNGPTTPVSHWRLLLLSLLVILYCSSPAQRTELVQHIFIPARLFQPPLFSPLLNTEVALRC
jgi:hypothetical protein